MTSPHLAMQEEVVDGMTVPGAAAVAAAIDDNPSPSNLTAADQAVQPAVEVLEYEASRDGPTTESHIPTEDVATPKQHVSAQEERRIIEPAIPQTPEMNGNNSYDGYNMASAHAHLDDMDVINPLFHDPFMHLSQSMGNAGIPAPSANGLPMDQTPGSGFQLFGESPYQNHANYEQKNVQAYASLEFADGTFYMNTISIMMGRDKDCAKNAAIFRTIQEQHKREGKVLEPGMPIDIKREHNPYSKSLVSESGGIIREDDDSDYGGRASRRKRHKLSKKSSGSSSGRKSRRRSINQQIKAAADYIPQALRGREEPHRPVDPAALRPNPDAIPFVPLHPSIYDPPESYKSISREHVKISFNDIEGVFEAEMLGRNGAFIDSKHYANGERVPLKHLSMIQVGPVEVKFKLPEIHPTDGDLCLPPEYIDPEAEIESSHRYIEGDKEMSYDFDENPRNPAALQDTSDEDDVEVGNENSSQMGEDDGEDERDDDEEEGDEEEDEEDDAGMDDASGAGDEDQGGEDDGASNEEGIESNMELAAKPEKKRGPGRPPKNGIMSKREQLLAKKEAAAQQKAAAKTIAEQPQGTGKNKVGRPRKHPKPESPPVKTEKRKYTKRKPKDPDAVTKKEGSGSDNAATVKEKKTKSARQPRSPSPAWNLDELSEEQLAKPAANYVQLIYEALTGSETGQMSLPQIYRAIQRKYPFFVFRCGTVGWQSSVRHNLSQHSAFQKTTTRDGKGWLWTIVPGATIEKEKKRRPTPPPPSVPPHYHQQILQRGAPQHMMPGPPGQMAPPPPGYMNGQIPPNLRPGQPSPYGGPVGQPNGYPMPPGPHPPQAFAPPAPAPPPGSYNSPYAPKPVSTGNQPPQPPQLAPDHRHAGPPPPLHPQNQHPNQPQGPPPQQALPPPQQQNDDTQGAMRAIEAFKTTLINSIKGKANNAEAVVQSAINRAYGYSTSSTGEPTEEKVLAAVLKVLAKFPNFRPSRPDQPPQQSAAPAPNPQSMAPRQPQQPPTQQQSPLLQGQLPVPQPTAASPHPQMQAPTMQRPNFAGHGLARPNMGPISRPAMPTPNMGRTNSVSSGSAPAAVLRSSAPQSNSTVPAQSGSETVVNGNPYSDAHVEAGTIGSEHTPQTQQSPNLNNGVLRKSSLSSAVMNDNGKRPLEIENEHGEDEKEIKKIAVEA